MNIYNWKNPDGSVENWQDGPYSRLGTRRFVYNAFKAGCAVAMDLDRRAFQLVWFKTGVMETIQFSTIRDEDLRLALEAIEMANNSCFAMVILLQSIGQDAIADDVSRGRSNDIVIPEGMR